MASFPARPGATASRRADQPPPIRRAAPGGSSRTRATATQSAVDGNAPGHPSESVLPRRDRAERGPGRPGSPYASADVPAIRPVQPYAAMPVSASRAGSSARRRPGTHPTAPSRNRPNWMICIPGYIAAGDVKPSLFGVMCQMSGCRARRMFALRNGQCPHQGSSSACTCVRHSHEAIGVAPGRADERGSRLAAIARHEPRRRGVRRRCTG